MSPSCSWIRVVLSLAAAAALVGCDPGAIGDSGDTPGCDDCEDGEGGDTPDGVDAEDGSGGATSTGSPTSGGSGGGNATATATGSGTPSSSSGGTGASSGGDGGPLGDSLGPCTDCRVHVPPGYAPGVATRLVVALHGDEGRDYGTSAATAGVIDLWRGGADDRGFIVLALACPAELGCNGAWSDWLAAEGYRVSDAALEWLDAQVDAIEATYAIDTSAEYLAGYSGGAYWLGYVAPARSARFAATAFVAGGMPAYHAFHGCPSCSIPGYFLGGDGDYRTAGQMSDTATAFDGCGQEIMLDLVTGDHQQTIASLGGGKAGDVLDWFLQRPLSCP